MRPDSFQGCPAVQPLEWIRLAIGWVPVSRSSSRRIDHRIGSGNLTQPNDALGPQKRLLQLHRFQREPVRVQEPPPGYLAVRVENVHDLQPKGIRVHQTEDWQSWKLGSQLLQHEARS